MTNQHVHKLVLKSTCELRCVWLITMFINRIKNGQNFIQNFTLFLVCKTLSLFFRTTTTSHGAIPGWRTCCMTHQSIHMGSHQHDMAHPGQRQNHHNPRRKGGPFCANGWSMEWLQRMGYSTGRWGLGMDSIIGEWRTYPQASMNMQQSTTRPCQMRQNYRE